MGKMGPSPNWRALERGATKLATKHGHTVRFDVVIIRSVRRSHRRKRNDVSDEILRFRPTKSRTQNSSVLATQMEKRERFVGSIPFKGGRRGFHIF